ncbi:hypothetical protein ACEWY4_008250 [Coilia grayii]|uniref:Ig-like domain-containing protein n=1 Tax=Coilia grayii TaxID=363190 RepID=A0ABD1KAC3_9TELE
MGPIIGCILILTGLYNNWACSAEECFQVVKARRDHKVVSEGRSLLLSCEVQHCGVHDWIGGWGVVREEETFSLLQPSSKFHIFTEDLTVNSTRINMNFISTNKSDTGRYQCRINWGRGDSSNGHLTYVNVTDTPYNLQGQSERSVPLRMFVYICACLSCPIFLALARVLSHPSAPAVPPRSQSTTRQSKRPTVELLYAELMLENGGHAKQDPQHTLEQPTVYSLVHF